LKTWLWGWLAMMIHSTGKDGQNDGVEKLNECINLTHLRCAPMRKYTGVIQQKQDLVEQNKYNQTKIIMDYFNK
jgi:hypothetical protein